MSAMTSQIIILTIVYSRVYSGADQRKHQSSASLAFVRGIYQWPMNSTRKGPVTREMFPFDDVIMAMHGISLFYGKLQFFFPLMCFGVTLQAFYHILLSISLLFGPSGKIMHDLTMYGISKLALRQHCEPICRPDPRPSPLLTIPWSPINSQSIRNFPLLYRLTLHSSSCHMPPSIPLTIHLSF